MLSAATVRRAISPVSRFPVCSWVCMRCAGWLRASQRKLVAAKSLPYRPWHAHDEEQPLVPGEVVELDIEIWPTSIVLPPGYRLALTVAGQDYDHQLPGPLIPRSPPGYGDMRLGGCAIHVHDEAPDRPPAVFDGTTTIYTGGRHASYLLLPVIPPRNQEA